MKKALLITCAILFILFLLYANLYKIDTFDVNRTKYGYIDLNTRKISKLNYDMVNMFNGKYAVVEKNDKCGVINEDFKIVIPIKYESIDIKDYSNLFVAEYGGKYGYLNNENQKIIPFIYDSGRVFFNNLAVVSKNRKYGVINKNGNIVIPLIYDNLYFTHDNLIRVTLNNKCGVLDYNGKEVIPCKYEAMVDFNKYYIILIVNGKDSLIKRSNNKVLLSNYYRIYFNNNKIIAIKKHYSINYEKEEIYDNNLNLIIPLSYDYIRYVNDDCIYIKKNGKHGVVNSSNKILIPFMYDNLSRLRIYDEKTRKFKKSDLFVVYKNGLYGCIDKNNKIIIPIVYDKLLSDFREGLMAVEKNNGVGFIDINNNVVIPFKYNTSLNCESNCFEFINGLAIVNKNESVGVINKKGEVVVPIIYDNIILSYSNIIGVSKEYKFKFVDVKNGKDITKYKYYVLPHDSYGNSFSEHDRFMMIATSSIFNNFK